MSKAAIDLGLFRSTSVKKYQTQIQKNQATSEDDVFMKPDRSQVAGMKQGSYDKLNEQGFAPEETVLENGDILIGKVSPIQPIGNSNKILKDSSEYYKSHISGVIDKVYTNIINNEGYEVRKVRVRSDRRPMIGDKFCIVGNTEVLTINGWKPIKDITINDKIATLTEEKILKYDDPIDTYKFEYKGDMYKLRSPQVDIDCTIDHELYVKKGDKGGKFTNSSYKLIPAKDIVGKCYHFKKNCINNNPDINKFTEIEGVSLDMNTWLKLFGIWIAEGWVYSWKGNDKHYGYDRVEICQCKPRIQSIIKNIITQLGYTYIINSDNTKIYMTDKKIAGYLKQFSVGAVNKSLPNWVWSLSQKQSEILAEYMMMGDGSKNNNGSCCYYTSSKKLANDFQRLCIHAGWSGSIKLIRKAGYESQIKGRMIKSTQDALSVRVIKAKNEPSINRNDTPIGSIEEIYKYEGDVYCLEVPSHIFMIRQNGKNVWIGNCSRHLLLSVKKYINIC